MSNKKKFIIYSYYQLMVPLLLVAIIEWFSSPYARWPCPRWLAVALGITVILVLGRHYTFSEEGVKAYWLGIRTRNIPWSNVKRLILFHNEIAKMEFNRRVYLVVEKQRCDPPFPDEGSAKIARAFFFMNPNAVKIWLNDSKLQAQTEAIEQFHKIDDIYFWLRDE